MENKNKVFSVAVALYALSQCLDLIKKTLNDAIPWEKYNATREGLMTYTEQYSAESGAIIGETHCILLDCKANHERAVRIVYNWCQQAIDLLTAFCEVDDRNTRKELISTVLENGIEEMKTAQGALDQSVQSLNRAIGNFTALQNHLIAEYNQRNTRLAQDKSSIRKTAYVGAVSGLLIFGVGIFATMGAAAIAVEGNLIPSLNQAFEDVTQSFENVLNNIKKSSRDLTCRKVELGKEIDKIEALKVSATTLIPIIELDDEIVQGIVEAQRLITLCTDYKETHQAMMQ